VEKSKIIDGSKIKAGDKLIGLASSGIHSNGYSLVRKILAPTAKKLAEEIKMLGTTLGEEKFEIKGIAHITGGGFIENIPRMLPQGLGVKVVRGSWPVLPIFANSVVEYLNKDKEQAYIIGEVVSDKEGLEIC